MSNRMSAGKAIAVRPRRTSHRGSVLAGGLAIDTRLTGENEARRRILTLLKPGDAVYRLETFLVIRFAEPIRMDTAAAPGSVLTRCGRFLSASPLESDEQNALNANDNAMVLAVGGRATVFPLDGQSLEDVSTWIDVSAFVVVDGLTPLGEPVATPGVQFRETDGDMRTALGVGRLDEAAAQLLWSLSGGRPGGWMGRFTSLFNLFRRGAAPDDTARGHPGYRRTRMEALRESLMSALWSTKLGELVGFQFSRRLAQLLAMFDSNDLDNALRHALPMGAAEQLSGRTPSIWFWLSWFSWRRKDLSITPLGGRSRGTITLHQTVLEMLRQRYRQAAERLEAQGKIEKAAFVLAELLNANEEAVSLLEKHGRLKLAAEVAEMRKLPPGLLIRQWFLAGERERAILIAQRTGAFADAVFRLESSHKEEGKALRLLWADRLARGGSYIPAVDVVWPVMEARRLALSWIDRAIAAGGPAGARMLARKAACRPDEFAGIRDLALELLDEEGEEGRRLATAFGEELLAGELTEEARILAVPAVRRLLLDAGAEGVGRLIGRLLEVADDPALRADARPSSLKTGSGQTEETPLHGHAKPVEIHRAATDIGAIPVLDAVETADGRIVAAIGEAGALLLSRSGKIIARFGEPAHHIVMSDHGDRAILLAKLGETFRLCRLDLIERRLRPWKDARFDVFATDFDGLTWFVARKGAVYAIDATSNDWRSIWKVAEDNAGVTHIRRNASFMSVHFWKKPMKQQGWPDSEIWLYEIPELLLRRRINVAKEDGRVTVQAIGPEGDAAGWRMDVAPTAADSDQSPLTFENSAWVKRAYGPWRALPLKDVSGFAPPELSEDRLVMPEINESGSQIHLFDLPRKSEVEREQIRAVIRLEKAQNPGVRLQGRRMVVFDELGRVLVVSLDTGAVLREHRLS